MDPRRTWRQAAPHCQPCPSPDETADVAAIRRQLHTRCPHPARMPGPRRWGPCCASGARAAGCRSWTWRSTWACPRATSAASRPAARAPVRPCCWRWPNSCRCRCASATGCCWPPVMPRVMPSARSTRRRWSRCGRPCSGCWTRTHPYPGVVMDRQWNVVLANAPAQALVALLPPALQGPPLNMMRASLHPAGLCRHHRQLRRLGPLPGGHAAAPEATQFG
jgi:hypothetical protein